MSEEEILQEALDLTKYEARCYLALLAGRMEPKEVSSRSGVPLPRVYDTLDSLRRKGFVEEGDDAYRAVAPEAAFSGRLAQFRIGFEEEMEGKAKRVEDLLSMTGDRFERDATESEVVMLRGIEAIASKFLEVLSESSRVYIAAKKALEAKDFFKTYVESTSLEGKDVRLLVPSEAELDARDVDLAEDRGIELRETPVVLFDMVAADGRDVLIGVPDPASEEVYHSIGIWVRNKSFGASVTEAMESLWMSADPLV